MTYANVAGADGAPCVKFGLGPSLHYVEAALSLDMELFPPESGTYVEFELDGAAARRTSPTRSVDLHPSALRDDRLDDPSRGAGAGRRCPRKEVTASA